jgi:hypothetical protein
MPVQQTHFWPRLALFLVVGIGAAVVWAGIGAFVVEGISGNRYYGRVSESISVLADGEAVIHGTAYGPTLETLPLKTLDRQPVDFDGQWIAPSVHFHRFWIENPPHKQTMGYLSRVMTVGEDRLELQGSDNAARWYAVRDGSDEGRTYLVGYDIKSKLPLGYIGRQGFRRAIPDRAGQFVVDTLQSRIVSMSLDRSEVPANNRVYLLDDDHLVEIDTIARTVREIVSLPSATMLTVSLASYISKDSPSGVAADSPLAQFAPGQIRHTNDRQLVVWQGDRVATVDVTSGEVTEYRLPAELPEIPSFQFHLLSPEVAALQFNPTEGDITTARLVWFNAADGEITRDETVRVNESWVQDERVESTKAIAVVPVPLVMGALITIGSPYWPQHAAQPYGQALTEAFAAAWPPFAVLLAVSAALALWVFRVHRRDARPRPALWSALVFLLGPPAFFAYLAEQRHTPAANCPNCGARTPRKRINCAACNQDTFHPATLGTEVFA